MPVVLFVNKPNGFVYVNLLIYQPDINIVDYTSSNNKLWFGTALVDTGYFGIGPASLARENEAGGSWGQEVHLLHVNI